MKFGIPILIILLFLNGSADAQTLSQSVIGATGSVNSLFTATVGEAVINTGVYSQGILTQGFQQPDGTASFGSMVCNLPTNHSILADTLSSGSYRAPGDVEFVGGTLQSGDFVSISAVGSIRFSSGFRAVAGSDLYAYIGNCTVSPPINRELPDLEDLAEISTGSVVIRCYPNPFRGQVTIDYELPEDGPVVLTLMDLNGRVVEVLENDTMREAGGYRITFNGGQLRAGMYYLALRTPSALITEKLILLL